MAGSPSKVLVTFGTRPEAIKLAPLVKALAGHPRFDMEVCVTAQHRSMLDQVLETFAITPRYDLDLMRPAQTLPDITARMVTGVSGVVRDFKPDWVVVQGDTTTALAAGLAAFYEQASVAHVEAGLRTHEKYSPFPEEINRRLVSCVADLHFAPSKRAKDNLLRENCPESRVSVSGNTIVDALLWVVDRLRCELPLKRALDDRFSFLDPTRRLILITGHRRESFGRPFESMCHALVDIVAQAPDVEILYPVHLNPNVQAPVNAILGGAPAALSRRIHMIAPVDYLTFVYLMNRAQIIITDSGGVQEEAPSLGKPVLVTRENTERPEAVEAGTARLTGTDRDRIFDEAMRLLTDDVHRRSMSFARNPYGDGQACARIVERLDAASGGPRALLEEFAGFTRELTPS
ncbi:MAG: UDP-N-acetylglucosamine 2-epimerase [Hyphomicrobiales bacterium]|nr:UDP-N-acetylglucosamine 2-epimerase [Hyphomicrobiales bacterium]